MKVRSKTKTFTSGNNELTKMKKHISFVERWSIGKSPQIKVILSLAFPLISEQCDKIQCLSCEVPHSALAYEQNSFHMTQILGQRSERTEDQRHLSGEPLGKREAGLSLLP